MTTTPLAPSIKVLIPKLVSEINIYNLTPSSITTPHSAFRTVGEKRTVLLREVLKQNPQRPLHARRLAEIKPCDIVALQRMNDGVSTCEKYRRESLGHSLDTAKEQIGRSLWQRKQDRKGAERDVSEGNKILIDLGRPCVVDRIVGIVRRLGGRDEFCTASYKASRNAVRVSSIRLCGIGVGAGIGPISAPSALILSARAASSFNSLPNSPL